MSRPLRIAILHSLTGGGHLAAARAAKVAIEELVAEAGPGAPEVEVILEDGLVQGTHWPLSSSPGSYNFMVRHARWMWWSLFHMTHGPRRARLVVEACALQHGGKLRKLIRRLEPDLLVSTHPLLTRAARKALEKERPGTPFAVVVTDLVTGNWTWYDEGADRLLVPSPEVVELLKKHGYDEQKILLTGQAVHPKCGEVVDQRDDLRAKFGWTEPVILVVGGGDGMGDIAGFSQALDEADLGARVVVICGRNEALAKSLQAKAWKGTVEVHGFVDDLHERMAAADLLVTKGGPGSVVEGCIAGLPILIYDYLPGQEIGNVQFVESRDLGAFTPRKDELVAAARRWLTDEEGRAALRKRAQAAAPADSARRIANGLLDLLPGFRGATSKPSA